MNRIVKLGFLIILPYLLILPAHSGIAKEYPLFYPDALLLKLGTDPRDIISKQEKFNTDPVHRQWIDHVHSAIPGIDPDREHAIAKIHTALLYLKDKINSAYLGGGIDQREFTNQSALLMQWFQKIHQFVLNEKEYGSLFGISDPDNEPETANSQDDGLGFPIYNPATTVQRIKEKFDARTITNIRRFYREHARELREFKKISETEGARGVDAAQLKNDMQKIEAELQTVYRHYCRKILTDGEFKMIFGSPGNEKTPSSNLKIHD